MTVYDPDAERMKSLPGAFGGLEELENEPPVKWLIPGWLALNELSVIYGQGGTFKSYIALGWTLQLASRTVPSMYVAAEGTSGLRSRVEAWRNVHNKHDLPDWGYYNANVHVDASTSLGLWMYGLDKYLEKQKKETPKLIVVDTLARNFSGDESSPKEVGQFIEGCEAMRRKYGAAILVIHHMGVTTNRERGTAALRNATFAMFQTESPRHTGLGGGSIELKCDRMKDAPFPDDKRVYFDTVDLDVGSKGEVHQRSQAMRWFPPKGKQKPSHKVSQ